MQDLDKEEFIKWFKDNSPHIGKGKTMENITKTFPDSSFDIHQTYPPYGYILHNTQAAKLINEMKDNNKIKTYKKGNAYCYEWIDEEKEIQSVSE